MSVNLTKDSVESFENLVKSIDGQVVVDFWAAWCGPCRAVAPVLDSLENEQKISVVKVDVDANPSVAAAFGISSIPSLDFYTEGEANKPRMIGAHSKHAIEAHIR